MQDAQNPHENLSCVCPCAFASARGFRVVLGVSGGRVCLRTRRLSGNARCGEGFVAASFRPAALGFLLLSSRAFRVPDASAGRPPSGGPICSRLLPHVRLVRPPWRVRRLHPPWRIAPRPLALSAAEWVSAAFFTLCRRAHRLIAPPPRRHSESAKADEEPLLAL
jgi:hypothetical protein